MKKVALAFLTGVALTLSLASCGETLLTQEQVDAEITKAFEAGKATVETEENGKCESAFETRVQEKVNALDMAAQQEAATMPGK